MAAAFGIRREDSLDSDEFPHESSCGDSHHHGNSGESSSDEGLEENQEVSQISQTLKQADVSENIEPKESETKPNIDKKGEMEKRKLQSQKSKELRLTTEKVNEIEVMKNSVSEWIDSVQNSQPDPDNNFESPAMDQHLTEDTDKEAAIKPEYLPKHKHAKSPLQERISYQSADIQGQGYEQDQGQTSGGETHSLVSVDQRSVPVEPRSSHQEPKHFSGAELIEQVANNLKNYDPRPAKEFLQQSPAITDSAIISVADHSVPPVSALNLLNTATDGYKTGAQNPHQGNRVQAPPGFSPVVNPYPMYPNQGPPAVSMYPPVVPQLTSTAITTPIYSETPKESVPSSNTVFLDKMVSISD